MSHLQLDIRLALEGFELRVDGHLEHRATAIFGPSGAGKSSLLEVIAGLRRGAKGEIRWRDRAWLDAHHDLPTHRRRIGYVSQDPLLFPHLSVWQNLLAGGERAQAAGRDAEATAREVATWLEIEDLLERSVDALSGGEQKRVALGRALVSDPHLLLLDEPLANLDLPRRRRLLSVLRGVIDHTDVPMVLVTHDPVEAQALCDAVWVMERGRIVARGRPAEVLSRPDPAHDRDVGRDLDRGFETVLAARWLDDDSRLELGDPGSGIEIVVSAKRSTRARAGHPLLGLPSRDILLASHKPTGLSARNILPAVVRQLDTAGNQTRVTVELEGRGAPLRLKVDVLASTPARLALEVGSPVYVVIKATACRVYSS